MLRKIFNMILVACIPVFFVNTAAADEYHYTNLLIGDRASGMGGAYTAISDDATGLYYNPAGVFYTTGRSLSASVNAYYNTEKTYKSVIGGNGWVRKSSSLLPNYFGAIQPVGNFKIGLSYAVPESITEDQDQTFHNLQLGSGIVAYNPGVDISTYIINFNNESNTYNFGPSIATELRTGLSAGLTLYYYQRKTQWILNQLIKTSNGGSEWTNDYYQTEESGLRPILGFMWTPADSVSIGLAVSKILIMKSDTSFQSTYVRQGIAVPYDTNNDGVADITVSDESSLPDGQSSLSTKRKYPTQASLGVAWFASPSLLLTGDINYFTKVSQENAESVMNLALGTEYYFSKNWALRGGFYTDNANTPAVQTGGVNQDEHIDLYGATLSVSHFTRNTSVTLGGGMTTGSGKAQIVGGSTRIQDAEARGWMFFLSSSYSY